METRRQGDKETGDERRETGDEREGANLQPPISNLQSPISSLPLSPSPYLLVVDQFEEAFTLCDDEG